MLLLLLRANPAGFSFHYFRLERQHQLWSQQLLKIMLCTCKKSMQKCTGISISQSLCSFDFGVFFFGQTVVVDCAFWVRNHDTLFVRSCFNITHPREQRTGSLNWTSSCTCGSLECHSGAVCWQDWRWPPIPYGTRPAAEPPAVEHHYCNLTKPESIFRQIKSGHIYLYIAFHNTHNFKPALKIFKLLFTSSVSSWLNHI